MNKDKKKNSNKASLEEEHITLGWLRDNPEFEFVHEEETVDLLPAAVNVPVKWLLDTPAAMDVVQESRMRRQVEEDNDQDHAANKNRRTARCDPVNSLACIVLLGAILLG